MTARYETGWEAVKMMKVSGTINISEAQKSAIKAAEAMFVENLLRSGRFQRPVTYGDTVTDAAQSEPEETPALKLTPDARKDLLALMASKI